MDGRIEKYDRIAHGMGGTWHIQRFHVWKSHVGSGTVQRIVTEDTDISLDDVSRELKTFLDYVAGKHPEDSFVEKLEDTVKDARKNREWRREYMTLLMRDQENIERDREQGLKTGILGMVSVLRGMNVPDEIILQKIQQEFMLFLEEAEQYIYKDGKRNYITYIWIAVRQVCSHASPD